MNMRVKVGVMGSAAPESTRLETGSKLVEKAEQLARVLAANGLDQPSLAEAPVDESALLRWFFEEQRGQTVPARLDLHAYATGYPNRAAFLQAVLREYYYVMQRPTGASR